MRNIKIVRKQRNEAIVFRGGVECHKPVICLGDHGCLLVCVEGVLSRLSTQSSNNVGGDILCKNQEMLEDVFQMQYVVSTGITYFVNSRGSFIQFVMNDNGVEELFQSEEGIVDFAVSPDSRFVAIVTKQNTLLLLTLPDLEVISQQILVETEATDATDSRKVSIVWRADGHYFAVNYKQKFGYQIKVFDENGEFHSKTDEENALLDSTLEWQPSGGLLAGVGKTPHGTVVSLFERNGLKRADFFPYEGKKDNYEDNKIIKLTWNTTSDILAVVYSGKVELWCRNNYVWMRKLVIRGPTRENHSDLTSENKLLFAEWDHSLHNRLHIVDDGGVSCTYDVTFAYTSGYAGGSAIVASWNGNSVYSTPFRTSCCPPPHCLFQSVIENDVKAVIVPEFWSGLLFISSTGELIFSRYDTDEPKQIRKISIPNFENYFESYDWLWPNRNTICCVSEQSITIFHLQNGDFEESEKEIQVSTKKVTTLNQPIVSIFSAVNNQEASIILLQTGNGTILQFNLNDCTTTKLCQFPQICSQVQTLSESIVIGHDPLTRKLIAGWANYPDSEPAILNNDCTSFTVFQSSVIYTTIQGSLEIRNEEYVTKFLEKIILGNELISDLESTGRYSRKCEKGSMIVRCCLNQMLEPSLILQVIPRGNLEIIYPRPLIIDTVKVIMREKENSTRYEKIMTALRRHRIDYRVLIDEMRVLISEEPDCRLDELLKTMIEQVKDSHSLVLLVTDLNQDYSDCILAIKTLLDGVLKTNTGKRMPHVEESYLASMAKLGLLEEALKSPLILGEGEENRDLVQHRVKFLSFYCENPDVLFDTALGTYDLSLASLVADCLGKDPKEYIPVLDGFQSMLELKRRFKIDDKLRRYAKAVINLVRDQRVQHDEIIKYMERHRLFTDVIKFLTRKLRYDEGGVVERSGEDTGLLLRESQCSYAQYLEERGKLLEAGILYRDSGNVDKAIECGTKSGNWEFALEVAYEHGVEGDSLQKIFKDILVQLEDRKMYGDAARICEVYTGDVQQAVYYYIKDRKWQQASTLSLKCPALGKAFREETVKPKLMEISEEQKEVIQQMIDDIESKIHRLRIVREVKAQKLAESGGMGDMFSDTESFMSGSSTSGSISSSNVSGKSYRSSKNKRKHERKVYSLKEGSKYEDLAIIAYLWNIFEKLQNELKHDASNAIESLWKFDQSESAIDLCENLEKLLHVADKCVHEIWSVPINEEVLESKFRIPPVSWSSALNKLALHDQSSKASKSTR